jgi:hypothetical protein
VPKSQHLLKPTSIEDIIDTSITEVRHMSATVFESSAPNSRSEANEVELIGKAVRQPQIGIATSSLPHVTLSAINRRLLFHHRQININDNRPKHNVYIQNHGQ